MYHKRSSYDVWFPRYSVQQTDFFVILGYFLLFYPPNNLENQNFEKTKITPGDIIILHMNILNGNHMFDSWDMEHNRQNFFSFWTNSCLSTLLSSLLINNPENQNFEKMKKTCVPYKCAINDTGNELLLHTSQIVIHILLTGKWFCKIS